MLVFRRCLLVLLMLRLIPGCGASDPTGVPSREPLGPAAAEQPLVEAPDRQAEAQDPKRPSTPDGSLLSDLPDQDEPPKAGIVMEATNLKEVAAASDPTSTELPPETQWETWCESLTSGTPEARRQAAERIAQTLRPFSSEGLAALLAHDSAFVRRGVAFDLLERFNPNDDRIAAAFIRSLADQDATLRHIALTAVRRLPHDQLLAALEPLTSLMISPAESPANRIAVIRLIASMQSQAQDALPLLHDLLQTDTDAAVRSASAVAITRVAAPPQAVQWLQRALADEPDPAVRMVLVVRLGRIGTPAAAALDELSQTLRTKDAELQRAAIDAMIAIGKPSVPHLILLLDSSDIAIRRLAVFALGSLGPVAADAAETLQTRLQDQDVEVRQLAEIALARIASSR